MSSKKSLKTPLGAGERPPTSAPSSQSANKEITRQKRREKSYSAALKLANSSVSSIFSTLMMLYFTGNSPQIFPMIMLGMSMFSPIKSIFGIQSTFSYHESSGANLFIPKLLFILYNCISLVACIWKANKMGLIPIGYLFPDSYDGYYSEIEFAFSAAGFPSGSGHYYG